MPYYLRFPLVLASGPALGFALVAFSEYAAVVYIVLWQGAACWAVARRVV